MDTSDEVNQEDLKQWLVDNLDLPHFITRRLVEEPMSDCYSGFITTSQSAKLLFMRVLTTTTTTKQQLVIVFFFEFFLGNVKVPDKRTSWDALFIHQNSEPSAMQRRFSQTTDADPETGSSRELL